MNARMIILIAAAVGMVIVTLVLVFGFRGRKSARGFDVLPQDDREKHK
jgi:hypothetical protein